MASSIPPQSNQAHYDKNHSRSKAQMCLKRILDFISFHSSKMKLESEAKRITVQKLDEEAYKVVSCGGERGFIDLNLRLGPCFETEKEKKGFSACSGVGEDDDGRVCGIILNCSSSLVFGEVSTVNKSSEGECDPKEVLDSREEAREVVEDGTREFSEITNLQVRSSEIETKEECGIKVGKGQREVEEQQSKLLRRSEGYLDLLVEAARLISGNLEEDDDHDIPESKNKPSQTGKEETQSFGKSVGLESKEEWMMECYGGFEDDISPIVRSKRGRNQVLPYRYRDSVLEPWKRLTKQRSSRAKPRSSTK